MKYSGIDLHSNNSVVTMTDEADRVMAEKRLPNDLAKIVGFLSPWRDELKAVVVESSSLAWGMLSKYFDRACPREGGGRHQ